MTTQSTAPKRDVRYVTIEPGRISLHGVSLTDSEYAVLRGIAERMKRKPGGQTDLPTVEQGIADKPAPGECETASEIGECIHLHNPRACYRVRCQLGKQCINDDMSPRQGVTTC